MARVGCFTLVVLFILFVLMVMPEPVTLVPWTILTGWIAVVGDVIPRMTWNWEMITTGAVCLALFVGGFHWLAGWLYRHNSAERVLPWRWTLSVTSGVVLLFVAGISVIGLVHQSNHRYPCNKQQDYARCHRQRPTPWQNPLG